MHWLRRGDGCIRVAHLGRRDGAALDDEVGLHAEEGGRPDDEIRELTNLYRADMARHPMRDGRIDRVFRNVAPGAQIVVPGDVTRQRAALALHLIGRLPGSDYDLA